MMVTVAWLQSWPSCVAVSNPPSLTPLATSFLSNFVLTAASVQEDSLHLIPQV